MNESKHIYRLELTERQAKLLSYACDQFPRLIQGQDNAYQDLFESAWEKRCKEATGNSMDKEWDGGWMNMRMDAETVASHIKKRFWGLDVRTLYGIHYDDTADILWDIHRVLRHQFYKDRGDTSIATVDSEHPTSSIGSEPLAEIRRMDVSCDNIKKDMAKLYADIDRCIMQLIHGRAENEEPLIANAQHKMEALMVRTQQELRVIADYLNG